MAIHINEFTTKQTISKLINSVSSRAYQVKGYYFSVLFQRNGNFPTIFIYKMVNIVLFTYLASRDAVSINEIIPTKDFSSLEMSNREMLFLPCHSYITLLTLSGPEGRIKKKQISIHSEKYLMRFFSHFPHV